MRITQASGIAIGTAAVRAIESEIPANERICYDSFARRFVDMLVYLLMKLFAWYGEWHTKGRLTVIEHLTHLYCTSPNRSRKVGRIYAIVHAEVGN